MSGTCSEHDTVLFVLLYGRSSFRSWNSVSFHTNALLRYVLVDNDTVGFLNNEILFAVPIHVPQNFLLRGG